MAVAGNGEPIFDVSPLPSVKENIKAIYKQARLDGIEESVLAALLELNRRLEKDPRNFGEPVYRRPKVKLVVRHAAIAPIYIRYAVHEEEPVVFLMEVTLFSF